MKYLYIALCLGLAVGFVALTAPFRDAAERPAAGEEEAGGSSAAVKPNANVPESAPEAAEPTGQVPGQAAPDKTGSADARNAGPVATQPLFAPDPGDWAVAPDNAVGSVIEVRSPDHEPLALRIEKAATREAGKTVYSGALEAPQRGSFTLAVVGSETAGVIRRHTPHTTFRIRPGKDGRTILEQAETQLAEDCATCARLADTSEKATPTKPRIPDSL